MYRILIALLFTFHSSLFTAPCFAQHKHRIDSLENEVNKYDAQKKELGNGINVKMDSIKAMLLYAISIEYWGNNPEKALDYAQQCLDLSEQIEYKNGIAKAYNSMGVVNDDKGNYHAAIDYYQKALNIFTELKNKKGIAGAYGNIGLVYLNEDNYPDALKNYLDALKIKADMKDTIGMATMYNNIGVLFYKQKKFDDALKNYETSLKISIEAGNKGFIARAFNNIGLIYKDKNIDSLALENFRNSIRINEELGEKNGISDTYINIGEMDEKQGRYDDALKSYFLALKIKEEIGSKKGMAIINNNIGAVYAKRNNYSEAIKYEAKGLALAKEIGAKGYMKSSYENLAGFEAGQHNYKDAYEYEVLFKATNDFIFNADNERKLTQLQMQYDFDKKQDSVRAEQAKKDAVSNEVIKRQTQLKNAFIVGFILVVLLALILYNRYRIKQSANIALEEKNKIINQEKERSESLLLNILPAEVAEELKNYGKTEARDYELVTVMFTDFKDFTKISEQLSPAQLVKEIDTCFSYFDFIIHKHGIEKIKTIGDAYMCAGGLPIANHTHAIDVVKAGIEIRDYIKQYNQEKVANGEAPFEIRIGINTGPVVAGIVGVRKFAYDIWGDTVNLASRMESSGVAGEVNISESTYELVKDKFQCTPRGKIQTKSKGEVEMYFVV